MRFVDKPSFVANLQGSRNGSVGIAAMLLIGRSRNRDSFAGKGKENFLFCKASSPTVGPTASRS
jgi:hypothetical protein